MAETLQRVVATLYDGRPVPPEEGGQLFRAICEECRRREDLFWTERRLESLARELGIWPWSLDQIGAAMRSSVLPTEQHDEAAPACLTPE